MRSWWGALLAVLLGVTGAWGAPIAEGTLVDRVMARLEGEMETQRKVFGIPGMAVAVVQDGRVLFAKGYGVRRQGGQDPVTPETIFQMGSTTKAFTSALVALLVEQGRVRWEDRVVDHLPAFRMYDPWVTREFQVQDLMAQHSGLPAYSGDLLALLGFPRPAMIRALGFYRPVTSFRSSFAYVNHLWLVAAALYEAKSGETWEEGMNRRLLGPLGMESSTLDLKGFLGAPNRVSPHRWRNGRAEPIPDDWPFQDWVYLYGPAGGLNASLLDMTRWTAFQLSGEAGGRVLLKPETRAYLHRPQTVAGDGSAFYCLGWVRSDAKPHPLIWHNGGTSGCHTLVQLVPEAGLGLVVLTNLDGTGFPEALGRRFVDLWFRNPDRDWFGEARKGLAEERREDRAPSGRPARPLKAYEGIFENPVYGRIQVVHRDGALRGTWGPRHTPLAFLPAGGDTFALELGGTEALGAGQFLFGEEGLSALRLESLDDTGMGRFDRVTSSAP